MHPRSSTGGRAPSRSARSTACTAGTARSCGRRSNRPRAHGDHARPASADRPRESRGAADDAGAAPRAPLRGRDRGHARAAFTPEFMRLDPEEFVETYLRGIGAEAVAVGQDFRFGSKRAGSVETLRALGLHVLEVEELEGVSSSAIRDAVRDGDLATAASMLGRPFELDGTVVTGDQRGGTLGYPTANIAMDAQPSARATASTRARRSATGPPSRSAPIPTTAGPSGGSSRSSSTSTATSTARGSWWSCGSGSATRRCSTPRRR